MTHTITHLMPDYPTARRRASFTLNHLILPTWLLPRLLEDAPTGRRVTKIGMTAPVTEFDPDEKILAFGRAVDVESTI